ncbi:MAG: M20 family metallopeptidase, partial [Clostridiales bacterium]|nr:M20 family metallopeptidase [Clostridiales bacterium]
MNLNKYIDNHREDVIRSVQDIIRIPSVKSEPLPGKPFGEKIDEALRNALALADRLG